VFQKHLKVQLEHRVYRQLLAENRIKKKGRSLRKRRRQKWKKRRQREHKKKLNSVPSRRKRQEATRTGSPAEE
jgi:hypothetical protein